LRIKKQPESIQQQDQQEKEKEYSLKKFEMETSFLYNKEDKLGIISTHDQSLIKTLDEYCKKYPKDYQHVRDIIMRGYKTVVGKEYTCLKKYIALKKPSLRKLTDEQRAKAGERLRKNNPKINS
jgi:hypothetical protein